MSRRNHFYREIFIFSEMFQFFQEIELTWKTAIADMPSLNLMPSWSEMKVARKIFTKFVTCLELVLASTAVLDIIQSVPLV